MKIKYIRNGYKAVNININFLKFYLLQIIIDSLKQKQNQLIMYLQHNKIKDGWEELGAYYFNILMLHMKWYISRWILIN